MALKLVLNPTTGKLDLVQNLSGYVKISDLTAYAKLDGTNQPFTDDIAVQGDGSASVTVNAVPDGQGGIDTYTKLMLHMDGEDGGITFTDSSSSNRTVSRFGNSNTSTAQKKFGTTSGLFDGNGDYLTVPNSIDFAFGTESFTIDGWFYITSFSTNNFIYDNRETGLSATGFSFYVDSEKKLLLYTAGENRIITNTALSAGWNHIALVRDGNVFSVYINGIADAQTWTGTLNFSNQLCRIGEIFGVVSYPFNGYIDEFRISKGIARWTSNFTPPTEPYSTLTPTPQIILKGSGVQKAILKTDGSDSDKIKLLDKDNVALLEVKQTTGDTVFTGTVTAESVIETTPTLLKLDQTTPQTVTDFFKINTLTAGSVLFGGTDGLLAQDNSKLFWDNSTKRLGIGTTAPVAKLDVNGDININVNNLVGTGSNQILFLEQSGYGGLIKYNATTDSFIIGTLSAGVEKNSFSMARNTGAVTIGDGGFDLNSSILYLAGVQAFHNIKYAVGGIFLTDNEGINFNLGNPATNKIKFDSKGNVGIGTTSPTAVLHLKAGTSTASTSPLKFTSGTLLGTAEVGAIEFLSDDFFATITTGAARKGIILDDGSRLTSGKIPVATTNGRLVDLTAQSTEADLKVDYTSGDLDTEAEVITAINTTNAKINSIIAKLKTLGLLATS